MPPLLPLLMPVVTVMVMVVAMAIVTMTLHGHGHGGGHGHFVTMTLPAGQTVSSNAPDDTSGFHQRWALRQRTFHRAFPDSLCARRQGGVRAAGIGASRDGAWCSPPMRPAGKRFHDARPTTVKERAVLGSTFGHAASDETLAHRSSAGPCEICAVCRRAEKFPSCSSRAFSQKVRSAARTRTWNRRPACQIREGHRRDRAGINFS